MSDTENADEESFSVANSFDEIGQEIAEEMDGIDEPAEQESSQQYVKPLREHNDDRLLSDFVPTEPSDSAKGTYHELSSTIKRAPLPRKVVTESSSDSSDETEPAPKPHRHSHRENPRHSYHHHQHRHQETESEFTLGASPFVGLTTASGRWVDHRLSGKNVGDAMITVWDRFWSDDMKKILKIVRHRFRELLPHVRRFLAHVVAFWGGVTYIRRALSAFLRILQKDDRVRELLERLGWASSTTLRVFMSLCAMVIQASIQFYFLLRDRVIPQMRRFIPKCYYKVVMQLLRVARHSPWAIALGPFSWTFAVDRKRIPDPYLLHHKFGVPENDNTFALSRGWRNTTASSYYDDSTRADTEQQTTTVHEHTTTSGTTEGHPVAFGHAKSAHNRMSQHHHKPGYDEEMTTESYDKENQPYRYEVAERDQDASSVDFQEF